MKVAVLTTVVVAALLGLCAIILGWFHANDRLRYPISTQPVDASLPVPETHRYAIPVLMYHRVSDLPAKESHDRLARDLTVSPSDFAAQMRYLSQNGYTFVSTEEIVTALRERRPLPMKAVAVTFDDGYRDVYTYAFPILQQYHIPATIFLVATTVGTPGHLSWKDIQVMQAAGIRVGSHCMYHDDLTRIPIDRLQVDLSQGRLVLESRFRMSITELAYPAGKSNATVVEMALADGYRAGWRSKGGFVAPSSDLFSLPRIRVRGTDSIQDFARKLRQ